MPLPEPEKPERSKQKAAENLVAEYLAEMGIQPETAEKYAKIVTSKSTGEKPMVLVRMALAQYEADEAAKKADLEAAMPGEKKRNPRKTAAEKAKAEDVNDLRNAQNYDEMKGEGDETHE